MHVPDHKGRASDSSVIRCPPLAILLGAGVEPELPIEAGVLAVRSSDYSCFDCSPLENEGVERTRLNGETYSRNAGGEFS